MDKSFGAMTLTMRKDGIKEDKRAIDQWPSVMEKKRSDFLSQIRRGSLFFPCQNLFLDAGVQISYWKNQSSSEKEKASTSSTLAWHFCLLRQLNTRERDKWNTEKEKGREREGKGKGMRKEKGMGKGEGEKKRGLSWDVGVGDQLHQLQSSRSWSSTIRSSEENPQIWHLTKYFTSLWRNPSLLIGNPFIEGTRGE